MRVVGDQVPALVTAVDEEGFDAVFGDGTDVRVPLSLLRWAREYRSVNQRGPRPELPGDVVERGHLVRLRMTEDGWALGQVPEVEGALVALHPKDGAVRALVGGYDFTELQFNHALQAQRQPGSSFKPFVYAAAIVAGRTPATIYRDAPSCSRTRTSRAVSTEERLGDFGGPTRMRTALYRSINLVSMRVLLDLGASNVIDYVTRFGFDTRDFPRNLQLAIGGGTMAVAPIDMARAYTVFANGGFAVEPHLISRIELQGEGVIYEAARPSPAIPPARPIAARRPARGRSRRRAAAGSGLAPRVLDERTAFIMNSMLGDVVRYGTARRALEREDLGGKTGTTNAADVCSRSARTRGHGLVGFADNRPLGDSEFGSNLALPIWVDLMGTALADVPNFVATQPPGVVRVRIDPDTAGPHGLEPDAIFELFLAEYAPTPVAQETDQTTIRPREIF